MGFTRYYTINGKLDPERFKSYSKDCKFICDKIYEKYTGQPWENRGIAGWDGTGDPEFTDDEVVFNGIGDMAHETFSIGVNSKGFNFTKTQLKDYDKYVYACLLLAGIYFKKDIKVSSDGDRDDYPEITGLVKSFVRDNKIIEILDDKL